MAEIKNTFTSGKMNKDLDERLIPKGEYRDALNIDVVNSESSDVGSIENCFGTVQRSFLSQVGNTCIGSCAYGKEDKILWFIRGPVQAGTGIDLIAEYNVQTGTPRAVLVDVYQWKGVVATANQGSNTVVLDGSIGTYNIRRDMTFTIGVNVYTVTAVNGNNITLASNLTAAISSGTTITFHAERVLNFSAFADRRITGINVIDGYLYWADAQSEPKKIKIKRCISGTPDPTSHTKHRVNGTNVGYIKEEHITVIKKYPLDAPTVSMSDSPFTGAISATCTTAAGVFTYQDQAGNVLPVPAGTSHVPTGLLDYTTSSSGSSKVIAPIVFIGSNLAFDVGHTIKLKADATLNGITEDLEVRLVIDNILSQNATGKTTQVTVASISAGIPSAELTWVATLEQEDPFYELVFPRFAYRWKYQDGEYSAISPFTDSAFLPEKVFGFDYDAQNGFNKAMTNNVRTITLGGWAGKPVDVTEVDILYKEDGKTAVYTLETLKKNEITFDITSELIHALLPSNQMLRPYDNVPRYAKAQEITGNRLVYGNYTQQYDLLEDPEFVVSVNRTPCPVKIPNESLKSIRTYQVGVVFLDKYGRQTPVFSSDSATVTLHQQDSDKINKLQAKITTAAPSWATHYKYYVKEPSAEYYNLAMDRWYDAEDGNVWISFPSSERNKVAVDDYLILKKEHSSNVPVHSGSGGTVKYKILAIDNEAPDFLKQTKSSLGKINTQFGRGQAPTEGFPQKDFKTIMIPGADIANSSLKNIASESTGDKYLRFGDGSGNVSEYYEISSITRYDIGGDGDYDGSDDYYEIELKTGMGADVNFTGTPTNKKPNLTFEWFIEELDLYKAEFVGRFFIKINKDSALRKHLLDKDVDRKYIIKHEEPVYYLKGSRGQDDYKGAQIFSIDYGNTHKPREFNGYNVGKSFIQGNKKVDFRLTNIGPEEASPGWFYPGKSKFKNNNYKIHQAFRTVGTLFRWKDDPDQTVYEIISVTPEHLHNWSDEGQNLTTWTNQTKWTTNHGIRYKMTLDQQVTWSPVTSPNSVSSPSNPDSKDKHGNNAFPLTRWKKGGSNRKSFTELQILEQKNDEVSFVSRNPAIFETEPKERVDLNLYYETKNTYLISDLGTYKELSWYNCFTFGNGVESDRIRDDFNASRLDNGPRVSTELAEPYKSEHKTNGLIWSGIYNSNSRTNNLNQFIQAEAITKDLNPTYGSIQKLFSRNTNILAFCEDKVLKILANKDALFNADGSNNLTATNKVLGQSMPFLADHGISTHPESFAEYAFRIYFADYQRNAICRLSNDGIEEITRYSMTDYFGDAFNAIDTGELIVGTYDEDKHNYNITINSERVDTNVPSTTSFTEKVTGWTSRKSFIPESGVSLNGTYYTFKNGELWEHNANATRNSFYGAAAQPSTVDLIFNDEGSSIKNFKTINYEGTTSRVYDTSPGKETAVVTQGWYTPTITTDQQDGHVKYFIEKEGKWYNYIKGVTTTWDNNSLSGNLDVREFSTQGIGNITSNGVGGAAQTVQNVTVSINPTTSNPNFTASIPQIITATPGETVNNSLTFTLSPVHGNAFYPSPNNLTFTSETSSPVADAMGTPTGLTTIKENGDIDVVIPLNFTMPSANQSVTVNIAGRALKSSKSINGTLDIVGENFTKAFTPSGEAYSGTGAQGSGPVTLKTVVLTAASNHKFSILPALDTSGLNDVNDYDITVTETTGSIAGGDLTVVTIVIKYTFPASNVTGDVIGILGTTETTFTPSTDKIYNYQINESNISHIGETRSLVLFGDPGATVTIEAENAANTSESLISGPKTVTIASTTDELAGTVSGQHTEEIYFPPITGSSNITYNVTLTETSSDSFQFNSGNSPKVIALTQAPSVDVSFAISKTSTTNLTIPSTVYTFTGNGSSYDPRTHEGYEDPVVSWVISSQNNKLFRLPVTPTNAHITEGSADGELRVLTGGTKVLPLIDIAINNAVTPATATVSGDYSVHFLGTSTQTATLNLDNLISLNTAPTTSNSSFTANLNGATTHGLTATDADGDSLSYTVVNAPSKGTLSISTNGVATYTRNVGQTGTDLFRFKVSDGLQDSNTATVNITLGSGSLFSVNTVYKWKDLSDTGNETTEYNMSAVFSGTLNSTNLTSGSSNDITLQVTDWDVNDTNAGVPTYMNDIHDFHQVLYRLINSSGTTVASGDIPINRTGSGSGTSTFNNSERTGVVKTNVRDTNHNSLSAESHTLEIILVYRNNATP